MQISAIKPYEKIYRNAKRMGADRILRKYLNVSNSFPIPLSIAHGVDLNDSINPLDAQSIEPIHWSFNETIHERVFKIKPSIRMPHPWIFLKNERERKIGTGVLVIGPPPSRANDTALFDRLNALNVEAYDILLKYRGQIDLSEQFWTKNGVMVVSAGLDDHLFYERLFAIIEQYEFVIGCTLSSALFFAASIGKKCKIVEGYTYLAYEASADVKSMLFKSELARNFLCLIKAEAHATASALSLKTLGEEYLVPPNDLLSALVDCIHALKEPVYTKTGKIGVSSKVVLSLSLLLGRTSLISYGVWGYLKRVICKPQMVLIQINEIDVWINGISNSNYKIITVPYIKNVTVGGWGEIDASKIF